MWLRDVQEREEAGEWRRPTRFAMNAPTLIDYMAAMRAAMDRLERGVDLSPLVVWPGEPVDEDDIVRRVMDGPARRV